MQQNPDNPMLDDQQASCIQDCLNCHTVCLDSATTALQSGNQQADHIRLMLDCSEICLTAAHFMIRNSPLYGYVAQACASVCSRCADVCFQAGMNDCGNACQTCAQSCQQMVKMMP